MSNLVLGTAFEYGPADVAVFVKSLRRYYDGPVILLVSSFNSEPLLEFLKKYQITPAFFDSPYWSFVHPQMTRFSRYNEILLESPARSSRILLTDVSDVLFQNDPFADLPPGELLCFMEGPGLSIGQSKSNAEWVSQMYGPAGLDLLRDKPVSCSGTTIGTHDAILNYLRRLLAEANPQVLRRLDQYRGHDQGIHNYLLHTGKLPFAEMVPNGQHVFTVGALKSEAMQLAPGGVILTNTGWKPAIVHQYTYREEARRHVLAEYGD